MLRRRVVLALIGLIVAMALLLRGLLWLADVWVEDAALQDLLEHEMSFILLSDRPPDLVPTSSALRYYRPHQDPRPVLPPELQDLAPGLHEDVKVGGEPWRVLVHEVAPGDKAYLMYLVAFVERRERALAFIATGGMLLMLVGAWWLARTIAGRALAPLDEMVGQIRGLEPGRTGQRLAAPEADRDLDVIVSAINGYLDELERLVERERSFAAAASHELRTPLAVIHGSLEMLKPDSEVSARALARMRRALGEAIEQLEAILALSRTRDGPPLEEIALDQWLAVAAESHIARAGGGARVRWDCEPARLVAPPGAVRIVFGNLLQNALRSTPDGVVMVTVRPGQVIVEDAGPGVPADVLPHVFEPGFRGREGGSGMGLYIARSVAERYGWRLTLENRDGGGARATWSFEPAIRKAA